ncbi:alpha beta hydrolase [Nannochloropsis oceanica]
MGFRNKRILQCLAASDSLLDTPTPHPYVYPDRRGILPPLGPSTLSFPPPTQPLPTLHHFDLNRREDSEDNLPVVVLHGLLGSSRNFRGWASALHERLEKPRRILVPDLRNHGQSPHVGGMSYREMVHDVLRLLDAEGIGKCVVVGHSMGGKVAAAAGLSHPDRIAGLVVMDIAPVTYSVTDGTNWQDTHEVITLLSSLPLSTLTDKGQVDVLLQEKGLTDAGMRAFAMTNLLQGDAGVQWQINLEGIKSALPEIAAFDVGGVDSSSCSAAYPHKTLFLNGGKSKYLRTAHLSTIAQLFPTFSLATIRDAGHWVHAEKPEETLNIIQRYLDEELEG